MSARKAYSSNARFIEIAPPGISFRAMVNIDHLHLVRFENKVEMRPADPMADPDDENTEMRPTVTGFKVIVGVGAQNNEFTFAQPEVAIDFYNDILDSASTVGAPICRKPAMEVIREPQSPSPYLDIEDEFGDVDGEAFEDDNVPSLLDSRGRALRSNDALNDDEAVPGIDDLDELPGEAPPEDDDTTQH